MVDMEPVQSRTLDAESKQRALWPFKPPNPGRKWENSCSSSTGQYQDTQYDEQPKRHDKRRYARLAPRESLSPVPERSSSPEAPNTPASSPRREDEDAGPTGEVKRKAEWVGNSLDLTLEDSQDDSPPESKDETRLSEADATTRHGVSALHLAAFGGHVGIVHLLLSAHHRSEAHPKVDVCRACFDLFGSGGPTALHLASCGEDAAAVIKEEDCSEGDDDGSGNGGNWHLRGALLATSKRSPSRRSAWSCCIRREQQLIEEVELSRP